MHIKAYFEVLRPVNCVFGALSAWIGILNALTGTSIISLYAMQNMWVLTIGALIIYFLVAGASNLINDYFDIEIDKINRPDRPLPRGDMSKKNAIIYFLTLCVISVTLTVVFARLTPNMLILPACVAFFLFVGYMYAWKGKPSGFPGNVIVGISFSFGIPFGVMFIVSAIAIPIHVWFFFLTSASLLIARELVKGMEDMEGDKKFKIKTIANTRGTRTAAKMSIVFSILAIAFFTAPVFFYTSNFVYPILVMIGNAGVIFSIAVLLKDHDEKKNQTRSSLLLKGGAFIGLVAYLIAPL